MKSYTGAKEFRNILSIDHLSSCCGAVVYPDSDICSDCKEHCGIEETCDVCEGKGVVEIIDEMRVHSRIIDIPYKTITCEKCQGQGYVEVDE